MKVTITVPSSQPPLLRSWLIFPVVILVITIFGCQRYDVGHHVAESSLKYCTTLLFGTLCFYCMITKCFNNARSVEVGIVVYPIGIQTVSRKQGMSIPTGQAKPVLIPRDRIIDCVVVERLLFHRVSSVVLLRIRPSAKNHPHPYVLLNVFPGINNMSHTQCLVLRAKILYALQTTTIT